MNQRSSGVRVSYKQAEKILKELRKHKAIELSLEFGRETDKLIIPVNIQKEIRDNILVAHEENYEV